MADLIRLIETLRGENGCPWDRKQTPRSLAVYLVEEVFELVDAIESGDPDAICEELGDVLFQVFFIAHLFRESGHFDIEDAAARIGEKMVRRHPHVFGDATVDSAETVRRRWHEIKKQENGRSAHQSVLDSIPVGLPALLKAYRVSERAARTGFDWDDMDGVIRKAVEEWNEFNAELEDGSDTEAQRERLALEFGDILFTLVNVARFAGIHPESALAGATRKFERRFRLMERKIRQGGREPEAVPREELDGLWEAAKAETD